MNTDRKLKSGSCFLAACALSLLPSQSALAATSVWGQVTSNTTWTLANSPYIVIGTVNVWAGVTLTIEPGVVVKFTNVYNINGGNIYAVGTSTSRIVFTSIKDDSIAGDTGGDGPTTGLPGEWGGIRVDGGTGTFDYVDMRYGAKGSGYTYAMLGVTGGGSISVDHSTFTFGEWGGLNASNGTATVAHSVFTQNRFGVSFYGATGTIGGNSSISSNSEIGIFMTYGSTYAGGPGRVEHSDIANNGAVGVLLWVDSGISTAAAPTGRYNNIHSNNGGSTAVQLSSLHNVPQSNWQNNYWGALEPSIVCPWAPLTTTMLHLAYSSQSSYCDAPPAGPIASVLFTAQGCPNNQLKRCVADLVDGLNPSATPIDNSGY